MLAITLSGAVACLYSYKNIIGIFGYFEHDAICL